MTIKMRNGIILFVCVVSVASALWALAAGFVYFTKLSPESLVQGIREFPVLDRWAVTPYSRIAVAVSAVLFSLVQPFVAGSIFFFFEKTRTREILFLAIFVFGCCFESVRLAVPLCDWLNLPFMLPVLSSKVVLFFRILAPTALLGAALSTSDMFGSDSKLCILIVLSISFMIAGTVVFNSTIRLSTFMYKPGYNDFITVFVLICGFGAALCYAITSAVQSITEYKKAALGCLLLFAGYLCIIHCDCFLFMGAGLALFLTGWEKLLKNTHRFYKWS